MIVLMIITNIKSLLSGGDGRNIKVIAKKQNIKYGKIARLSIYALIEIVAYLMIKKRKINYKNEGEC